MKAATGETAAEGAGRRGRVARRIPSETAAIRGGRMIRSKRATGRCCVPRPRVSRSPIGRSRITGPRRWLTLVTPRCAAPEVRGGGRRGGRTRNSAGPGDGRSPTTPNALRPPGVIRGEGGASRKGGRARPTHASRTTSAPPVACCPHGHRGAALTETAPHLRGRAARNRRGPNPNALLAPPGKR